MATLNENITRIEEAKVAIKNAIIGKGVAVDDTALLDTYASKIISIPTGEATPTSLDFGTIGYTVEDPTFMKIQSDLAYTVGKYNEWKENPNISSFGNLYYNDTKLVYAPLIDTSKTLIMNSWFDGCTSLTTIPQLNTSNVTGMGNLFNNCKSLNNIPQLDTSNVTIMSNMFLGCTSLTTIPQLNTSNVTDMGNMFSECTSLTTIPQLDTSNVTNMSNMFADCTSLTTIPEMDTSKVKNVSQMFNKCTSLTTIPQLNFGSVNGDMSISFFFGATKELPKLTDIGGFEGLKIDWDDFSGLCLCPNLTKQSVLNVINGLYDFRANGDTSTTKTIRFNSKSLALLSEEEKAIATNKGWNLRQK